VTLNEYIKLRGDGAITDLSERSGISRQTIHSALCRTPSVSKYLVAKALSDATGGLVTIEDLCDPEAA